eukprot:COSAG05_NODE_1210_length_5500_cov_84.214960_3_plen_48_part_00
MGAIGGMGGGRLFLYQHTQVYWIVFGLTSTVFCADAARQGRPWGLCT